MNLEADLKNYPENGSVFPRTAAREIVREGTDYLLPYSLTSRSAVIEFCKELGEGVIEDYPFNDANWTVMRHLENKKGFAFLYEYHGRLQVNVKCAPEWIAFWRNAFEGVIPGYHMNKSHWNTVLLDGSVPDKDIKAMITESYQLTKPKRKGG